MGSSLLFGGFWCVFPMQLSLSLSQPWVHHRGTTFWTTTTASGFFFLSGLMPLLSHEQAHDVIFVLAPAATSQPAAAAALPLDRKHTPTIASPVLVSQSVIFDTTVFFLHPHHSLWNFEYSFFLDPRRRRRRHQPLINTRGNPGGGTGMGWDMASFISIVLVSIPGLFLSF